MTEQHVQVEFEDTSPAYTAFMSSTIRDNLVKQGYTICSEFLGNIGMKSAQDRFMEMQEHYRVDSTPSEEGRIEILYEATTPLQRDRKEIWVFDRGQENSVIQGQYDEEFIWLSREIRKTVS